MKYYNNIYFLRFLSGKFGLYLHATLDIQSPVFILILLYVIYCYIADVDVGVVLSSVWLYIIWLVVDGRGRYIAESYSNQIVIF